MNPKEAIQVLERMLDPDPWEDYGLSDKAKEALQVAVDALKKQIPMKPMKSIDPYDNSLYKLNCPTCGRYIAYGNSRVGTLHKFTVSPDMCGFCGQKIDFGG